MHLLHLLINYFCGYFRSWDGVYITDNFHWWRIQHALDILCSLGGVLSSYSVIEYFGEICLFHSLSDWTIFILVSQNWSDNVMFVSNCRLYCFCRLTIEDTNYKFWLGGFIMYIGITLRRYKAVKEVGKIKMSVGVVAYYQRMQICQVTLFVFFIICVTRFPIFLLHN